MKHSFSTPLLVVVVVMLAGYAGWQAWERRAAHTRVAQMHHQLEELRSALRANELELLAVRAQVAAIITTNSACHSPDELAVRNYLESYASLMRTPEMQTALRTQLDGQHVAIVYGTLLDGLAMSAEEKQTLRALLVERALTEAEPGFLLLRPGLDAAARAHIRSNIAPTLAAIDTKIKAMLTREDAARFDLCTSNADARIWVTSFNRHLERTMHAPMSAVQQEHAVRAFQQEFDRLRAMPDYVDLDMLAPDEITTEIAARYVAQQSECLARVHDRVATFLPAAAANTFNAYAEHAITAGAARLQLTIRALQH